MRPRRWRLFYSQSYLQSPAFCRVASKAFLFPVSCFLFPVSCFLFPVSRLSTFPPSKNRNCTTLAPCSRLPAALLCESCVNSELQKPANDAHCRSFPQENPRKTEVGLMNRRVPGVSTSLPLDLVVLYLTRTTWGGTFNLTRSSW